MYLLVSLYDAASTHSLLQLAIQSYTSVIA
jgi:hypothetical protein